MELILGLVLVAGIFAYLAQSNETEDSQGRFQPREAVVSFSNQFLAYSTILAVFFLTITKMNYTVLPASIVAALGNIYIVLMMIIFIFEFWSYLTQLKQDNIENPEAAE
ncbi:MAG: hypothetical protein ABEK04_03520 [Candidatus Nanohalobium sp.]